MEYYIEALRENAVVRYNWVLSMFAIMKEYTATEEYDIEVVDGYYHYLKDGELINLDLKYVQNTPMLDYKDKLELPAGGLINQPKALTTTLGRAFANQVMLGYPFGDTIEYINTKFSIRDVEGYYVGLMVKDGDLKPGKVSVSQSLLCKRGCELMGQLTRVLVHSATPKNIVKPVGIDAYKKKLLNQYKKEGKDINTPLVMEEFNNALLKFDEEYLKDDPSNGVYVSGKVKNMSRLKVHMAYGAEKAWSSTTDQPSITRSLEEGAISNKSELVTLNNTVRTASYSRGTEIILGGVTATLVSRIAGHLRVIMKDCRTKNTLSIRVREGEAKKFIGRTIIKAGKPVLITDKDLASIDGKQINLRSVTTCGNPVVCMICAGEAMSARREGLGLFAFGVSSKIVKASLKAFHGGALSSTKMDLRDIT